MAYSAFQSNAYQGNAYQIIAGYVPPVTSGGWAGDRYWDRVHEALNERRQKLDDTEKKLEKTEKKVEKLESKRLLNLSDLRLQQLLIDQIRYMHELEIEQKRLQAELLFWMREEDDILAILYSLPFMA